MSFVLPADQGLHARPDPGVGRRALGGRALRVVCGTTSRVGNLSRYRLFDQAAVVRAGPVGAVATSTRDAGGDAGYLLHRRVDLDRGLRVRLACHLPARSVVHRPARRGLLSEPVGQRSAEPMARERRQSRVPEIRIRSAERDRVTGHDHRRDRTTPAGADRSGAAASRRSALRSSFDGGDGDDHLADRVGAPLRCLAADPRATRTGAARSDGSPMAGCGGAMHCLPPDRSVLFAGPTSCRHRVEPAAVVRLFRSPAADCDGVRGNGQGARPSAGHSRPPDCAVKRTLLLVLGAFVVYAWWLNCVAEDAYITYRFARNVAEGHGFFWNVGEAPVEGFTNFLWLLLSVGAYRLGFDLPRVTQGLGVLAGMVTLVYAWRFSREILRHRPGVALFTTTLLAACGPLATWATSGLETVPFTLAVTMAIFYASRMPSGAWSRNAVVVAVCLLLATLTRPEGFGIFVIVAAAQGVLGRWQSQRSRDAVLLGAIYVPLFVLYFVWRYQ